MSARKAVSAQEELSNKACESPSSGASKLPRQASQKAGRLWAGAACSPFTPALMSPAAPCQFIASSRKLTSCSATEESTDRSEKDGGWDQ